VAVEEAEQVLIIQPQEQVIHQVNLLQVATALPQFYIKVLMVAQVEESVVVIMLLVAEAVVQVVWDKTIRVTSNRVTVARDNPQLFLDPV
jgi:hypothetical protein